MASKARKEIIKYTAEKVRKLLTRNLAARDRFRDRLTLVNEAWLKRWAAMDDELPVIIDTKPDKKVKPLYEYDRKFKCYILIDEAQLTPNSIWWEDLEKLDDKYPLYYTVLAVIYDSEEGKDAPYNLCKGVLDKRAFWFIKHAIYEVWLDETVKERLDKALDWVTADIPTPAAATQDGGAGSEQRWEVPWDQTDNSYMESGKARVDYTDNKMSAPNLSRKLGKIAVHFMRKPGKGARVHIGEFRAWAKKEYPDAASIFENEAAQDYFADIAARKATERAKGRRK